jgi:hypothetical protein
MLPPTEIDAGLLAVVQENFGASREELVQCVARDLGFAATSAQLRALLDSRIDQLVAGGVLARSRGLLVSARGLAPAQALRLDS